MTRTIVLFQNDLRLSDNPALYHAAKQSEVIPVFIDDPAMPRGGASRWWLHHSLASLGKSFAEHGVQLLLRRGAWVEVAQQVLQESGATAVYWNRAYTPRAIAAYGNLKKELQAQGMEAKSFNGSLLFEPWEIHTKQGNYFKVFTPFWKHCRARGHIAEPLAAPKFAPTQTKLSSEMLVDWHLLPHKPNWSGGLKATWQAGEISAQERLAAFLDRQLNGYAQSRDIPAEDGTSRLSPHLHFGEISARQMWHAAMHHELRKGSGGACEKFLSELGWREFSYYLLYHFPALPKEPFNASFASFPWETHTGDIKRWQRGQTGYPLVDAGMRELWHTGYMHNRVRMLVASFLTKDMMAPWQIGAGWFLDTLVDADLANNSAGWQWVAGCGADASPYYRIFNPMLQGEKFDPHGEYVKRWVPELAKLPSHFIHAPWKADNDTLRKAVVVLGETYPLPMLDHAVARARALAAYKSLKAANA